MIPREQFDKIVKNFRYEVKTLSWYNSDMLPTSIKKLSKGFISDSANKYDMEYDLLSYYIDKRSNINDYVLLCFSDEYHFANENDIKTYINNHPEFSMCNKQMTYEGRYARDYIPSTPS